MIGVKGLGMPVLQAVQNQYLTLGLMNGLAIVVSGIGMDSIAMNHIIFWSALIVGGLIWSSPRGNTDEPITVDDLFDQ